MRRTFSTVLVLAAVLAAGASQAQDEAPAEPPAGPEMLFLSDEELIEIFTGADLEGCYPDGRIWAERTAADGALYDLLRRNARVGEWWVEDRQICYLYTGEASEVEGTFCWNVVRQDGDYYFLLPGTGEVGGTTDCGDPIA